jgi:hypothetical protein
MRITVNHLTRMKAPFVCAAGVDSAGRSIRPVLSTERLPRSLLASKGGPFQLGVAVHIGDPQPRPVVPEVEDTTFNQRRTRAVERLDSDRFCAVLDGVVAPSLRSIFGPSIVRMSPWAAAVPQNTGTASLGVLRAKNAKIVLRTSYGKPDLRVHFVDPVLGALAIRVTDLRLWQSDQETPATANIERIENEIDDCYLAVGLSRRFPSRATRVCGTGCRSTTCSRSVIRCGRASEFHVKPVSNERSRSGSRRAVRAPCPRSGTRIHQGFRGFRGTGPDSGF